MIINILIALALLTVFVTLILGALNMRKTDKASRLRSNKLMRIRVASQFVAVILLFAMIYLKSKARGE